MYVWTVQHCNDRGPSSDPTKRPQCLESYWVSGVGGDWGVTSIFMTFHLPGLDEVRHRVNRDGFLKDSGKWVTHFWHGSPRSVPSKNTNFLSAEFLFRQANKLQVWGGIRVRGVARGHVFNIVDRPRCLCLHLLADCTAAVTPRLVCPSRERTPLQQQTPWTSLSATSYTSLSVAKHLKYCHAIFCRLHLIRLNDDISEGHLSFH